ncbi:MAG: hypothetical protein C0606_17060 [Hyphomicrobiales bacterium]|nr:MAG: hypothetical protein C0606_17060 [Hyphomicrobiales bacterium]
MMRFLHCERGNMTVLFSLLIPVLAAGAVFALDFANAVNERSQLQSVADAAALAATQELYLANASKHQVIAVAKTYARENAADDNGTLTIEAEVVQDQTQDSSVRTSSGGDAVEVRLTKKVDANFASMIAQDAFNVAVYARARVAGGGRICVIGLQDGKSATVLLDDEARLTAPTCSVYSNSLKDKGLGTIYLPKGVLIIDATNTVADQSAYTAIVAERLELQSSPNLVLNTNYGATDVPVPPGVGPVGTGVYLAR